jgi:uncharacterized membrane protein YgaE (UPF0421/DUF939 family)
MYEELLEKRSQDQKTEGEDSSKTEEDESTKELKDLVENEAQEEKKKDMRSENIEDRDEQQLKMKYPTLTKKELEELARFVKEFRRELEKISQLENPLFKDGTSTEKTLEEALKAILDRVVNRSIKKRDAPQYPVIE